MCVCMYMCICVSMYVFICVYVSLFVSVFVSVCIISTGDNFSYREPPVTFSLYIASKGRGGDLQYAGNYK